MTKIAKSHNTDYGNTKLYCIEYVAFGCLKYGFSKFKGTKTEKTPPFLCQVSKYVVLGMNYTAYRFKFT